MHYYRYIITKRISRQNTSSVNIVGCYQGSPDVNYDWIVAKTRDDIAMVGVICEAEVGERTAYNSCAAQIAADTITTAGRRQNAAQSLQAQKADFRQAARQAGRAAGSTAGSTAGRQRGAAANCC